MAEAFSLTFKKKEKLWRGEERKPVAYARNSFEKRRKQAQKQQQLLHVWNNNLTKKEKEKKKKLKA